MSADKPTPAPDEPVSDTHRKSIDRIDKTISALLAERQRHGRALAGTREVTAYQGAPGAFSEAAAIGLFGSQVRLEPCRTLEDVFELIARGGARYGVVPIENSLAGAVPFWRACKAAGLKPNARYAVFHCADNLTGEPAKGGEQSPGQYYESIDLRDAFHPQTILAYGFNGKTLEVPHGAPLRLRVERQLGYKMAKYIMRIEVVSTFEDIRGGKGGYWEDRGYEWFAGI